MINMKEELLNQRKSIAEFMGAMPDEYPMGLPAHTEFAGGWEKHLESFNYNTDWSWLMPVVEKIGEQYDVKITWSANSIHVTYIDRPDVTEGEISSMGGMTAIENTFIAVVKFIDWYNNKSEYRKKTS